MTDALLDVRDVSVSYAGAVRALHGVSLSVAEGSVVAVLGGNGAGKSTLLRAINFLAPPEQGSVTFMGETLTRERLPRFDVSARLGYEKRLRHFRTQMGMVFQHFNLFPPHDRAGERDARPDEGGRRLTR